MTEKIRGLYALVDQQVNGGQDLYELARRYAEAGVPVIQLRVKFPEQLSGGWEGLKKLALRISQLREKNPFVFIVNDYPELVREVNADGVHVGKSDARIAQARKIVGPDYWVGFSSHSLEEAVAASQQGADYVAFGAIFPTTTKGPDHPIQGVEKLRAVVQAVSVPVVAIGGINRSNVRSVVETGAAAFAMISALAQATNISKEVEFFREST